MKYRLMVLLPVLAHCTGVSQSASLQNRSVWFGPKPPLPFKAKRPTKGSFDYLRLFTPGATWKRAAQRVDVMKVNASWVDQATPAEVRQVVTDLKRRGISIALEISPLVRPQGVDHRLGGFNGRDRYSPIKKIKAAGGVVGYVSYNEPYAYASVYPRPGGPQWPLERVARELREFDREVRAHFPNVRIGDIEPLWKDMNVGQLQMWLDTYRQVTGRNVGYFHLDLDFNTRPNWPQDAKAMEAFCRKRGIPFGIIYYGNRTDTSDARWVKRARDRALVYERDYGGQPDHVIFQSWHDYPNHLLPETSSAAFTSLINTYFQMSRVRQANRAEASPGTFPGNKAGRNVPRPSRGRGKGKPGPAGFQTFTLTGVVPEGANRAVVGFRVNRECGGCSGAIEFDLRGVRYSIRGSAANRVPNSDFSQGMERWSVYGNAESRLASVKGSSGRVLHVEASPAETMALNSERIPVREGQLFTLNFSARITRRYGNSGFFGVIFLADRKEVGRGRIPFSQAGE